MKNQFKGNQHGFTIMEAMIAFVIVAIGLLAIGSFQGKLVSGSAQNKARTEAAKLAQRHMEEFREYTYSKNNVADDGISDKDDWYATNAVSNVTGSNAVYSITTTLTDPATNLPPTGDVEQVLLQVQVSWQVGENNGAPVNDNVTLNSLITYKNPRIQGDLSITDPALVDAPTGRAKLGDGDFDTGGHTPLSDNPDNTKEYQRNNDRILVTNIDGSGIGDVVLTLEEACVSGNCSDFVKISGRVYIDTASQNNLSFNESQVLNKIFVKASDAAYCQLWIEPDLNGDGNDDNHSYTLNSPPTTSNGDYKFSEYTCYLGGGWHGNIGILLADGILQSDKVCLGDPLSANAWEQPEIALRRSYRGMRYKISPNYMDNNNEYIPLDINGNPTTNAGGNPIMENGDARDIAWYSVGIKDGVTFTEHDFVISSMAASDTEGDKCVLNGIMVRTDSAYIRNTMMLSNPTTSGKLFENNAASFVCLNEDDNNDGTPDDYLDNYANFESLKFGAYTSCPYNPTDPPNLRHIVSGTLSSLGLTAAQRNKITVNTSDGPGNCTWDADGTTGGSYNCDVYDWGNGWSGYIQANGNDDNIICLPFRQTFSLQDNTEISGDYSALTLTCTTGKTVLINGTILITSSATYLTNVSITGGNCSYSGPNDSPEGNLWSFDCQSGTFDSAYSGTLAFTTNQNKYTCPPAVSLFNGDAGISQNAAGGENFAVNATENSTVYYYAKIQNNQNCP